MKKKIMVVDDDKEFLQELTELLVSNGFDVTSFCDGDSALKMINGVMPDAILLDLKMNNVSGFQVADRLKSMPEAKKIPVIAMTGYYTQEEYSLLNEICGVKKCITKPINPDKIVLEIENIIAGGVMSMKKRKNSKKARAKSSAELKKGSKFTCAECGLTVMVDQCCDCGGDHELLCCASRCTANCKVNDKTM